MCIFKVVFKCYTTVIYMIYNVLYSVVYFVDTVVIQHAVFGINTAVIPREYTSQFNGV